MYKNMKILTVLIVCTFSAAILFAQETIKIGVVDSQKVLETSNAGKQAIQQLNDKSQNLQNELEKMDKEIKDLENKLTTQRLTLSDDSIEKLNNDLQRKRTDRKRFLEDSQQEVLNLRAKLFNQIRNELIPIIQEIGQEQGYTLIVDLFDSGTIYYAKNTEITDEVVKRYNQKKAASQ